MSTSSRIRYVVGGGDRLSHIAARLGFSPDELIEANPAKPTMVLPSGARVFQSLSAGEQLDLPQGVGLGNPVAIGLAVSTGAAAIIEGTKTLYRSEAGGVTVCEEVYGGSWSYSKDKCIGEDGEVLDSTLPGLCFNLGGRYDASADACYCPSPGCTQMAPFILDRFPDLAAENRTLPPFKSKVDEARVGPEGGPATPVPVQTTKDPWPIVAATGAVVIVLGLGAAAVSVKLIVDAIERARVRDLESSRVATASRRTRKS